MVLASADTLPVINLLTTIFLAVLTGVYVWLTHRLLRAQTEPHVVVYAKNDESRPTIIQLIIENIGHGVAKEIVFTLSEPVPHGAFGMNPEDGHRAVQMTDGPIIDGIPVLPPRGKRSLDWGQYLALTGAMGDKVIIVTCKFKAATRTLQTENALEIASFKHGCLADPDGARQCAKALERINKSLEALRESPS